MRCLETDLIKKSSLRCRRENRRTRSKPAEQGFLLGLKDNAGVIRVIQRSNYSGIPYGHQMWSHEPLTGASHIADVKGQTGSSGINQQSNCLKLPYSHQVWSEESLTEAPRIAGVKVTQG